MNSYLKIKFVLFKGKNRRLAKGWYHQWYFRIVSANGKTVAQSEGYNRKASALRTIRSIVHGINPSLQRKDYKPEGA